MNQKNPSKTVWKESSICTKTWNNSVLQFMKVSDMMEADAGFLLRDTVVFVCEILDCCPWFEFADLEVSKLSKILSFKKLAWFTLVKAFSPEILTSPILPLDVTEYLQN